MFQKHKSKCSLKQSMLKARIIRSFGIYSSVVFALLAINVVFPFYSKTENTEATDNRNGVSADATLTFSSDSLVANVDLAIESGDGTFSSSTDGTGDTEDQRISFSISTDNYTGYTLSVAPMDNSTALTGTYGSIASIENPVTESDYSDEYSYELNNTWGFKPNYYNSVFNTSYYYPAVASSDSSVILRETTAANGSQEHADLTDDYNIALGVRADYNTTVGNYSNAGFKLQYVANIVGFLYTIEYDANDGNDGNSVIYMPVPNPNLDEYSNSTTDVELSDAVPEFVNYAYEFQGWCDVEPKTAPSSQCVDSNENAGTVYDPEDTYSISGTSSVTLYALWDVPAACNASATTIGTNNAATDAVCMQDINDDVISSMTTNTQYKLYDSRDYKTYFIAKMNDGKVWMTKNLDLSTIDNFFTSDDTDLGYYYFNNTYNIDSSMSTGVYCHNTVNPDAPKTSDCSGQDEILRRTGLGGGFSDPGDIYYYSSGDTSNDHAYSIAECLAANHMKDECEHYHVGNYYSWSAAVALDDASERNTIDDNSICPAGWRLPAGEEYPSVVVPDALTLLRSENIYSGNASSGSYVSNGFNAIRTNPLYMVRAGYDFRNDTTLSLMSAGQIGFYWTGTASDAYADGLYFDSESIEPARGSGNTNLRRSYYAEYDDDMGGYVERNVTEESYATIRCIARSSDSGKTVITFDKNNVDATGTMANQEIDANREQRLDTNTYTRTGYSLSSWNTSPDGNGTEYKPGATYYANSGTGTSTLTLYAIWSMDQTITFDKNANDAVCDGSNCADVSNMNTQTISGGSTARLIANGYSRPGYKFGGWMESSNGQSSDYDDRADYSVDVENSTSTKTLYARWIRSLTFAADTGIEMIIVADSDQNYKPLYAVPGSPVSISAETDRQVIVTVVPEPWYVLDSWSSDLGNGATTLTDDSLLTTTISSFSGNTETLTAVGTPATSENEYATMQWFSSSDCPVTTGNNPTGVNVTDSRDGKSYTVASVGDKCFMLSNLRLDNVMDDGNGGTVARVLSYEDSDTYWYELSTTTWDGSSAYAENMMTIADGQYYYTYSFAYIYDEGEFGSICPGGWTIPAYVQYANTNDINGSDLFSNDINIGMLITSGKYDRVSAGGSATDFGSAGYLWAQPSSGSPRSSTFDGANTPTYGYDSTTNVGYPVRCMLK